MYVVIFILIFVVFQALRDKICLRYIQRFQTMLAEAEHTMATNRTGTNLEITSTASENSNDRQTLNIGQVTVTSMIMI